jgi:hypothetical protein
MNAGILVGSLVVLLGYRVVMFITFWKLPHSLAPGRFFGLPVRAADVGPLLQRYRVLFFIPYAVDAGCALAVLFRGGLVGLVLEQAVAAVLIRLYHSFAGIHAVQKAKSRAVADSWKPARSVALLLKTRRLRDHTNLPFELILAALTVASLALLTGRFGVAAEGGSLPGSVRGWAFAALAVYAQLGGLLVKHGLVRWRMWLPGNRTEEYLRWREAVLRYWLWVCDYWRGVVTVALAAFAGFAYLGDAGVPRPVLELLPVVAGGGVLLTGILGYERQQGRIIPLWKALQPLEAFCSPPQPIDAREFFLAGLCYCNAENPALFVPGPLLYAVNLANKRTYLYAAYLAGLVALGIWCLGASPWAPALSASSAIEGAPPGPPAEALRTLAAGVRELVEDDEAVGADSSNPDGAAGSRLRSRDQRNSLPRRVAPPTPVHG